MNTKIAAFVFSLGIALAETALAESNIIAEDDASDSAYSSAQWDNSKNGGHGFGSWTLTAEGNDNERHSGLYIADVKTNADLNGIAKNDKAFGAFANGSGFEQAVGYRGRAATGRSAAVPGQVERIAGRAVQGIVAGASEAQNGAIRHAHNDCIGRFHCMGIMRQPVGPRSAKGANAAEGFGPARISHKQVFYRGRNARKRAYWLPIQHLSFQAAGGRTRILRIDMDKRVERGIALLDPGERRVDHLDRRDLLRPYSPGD